jgi:large subunit ribosomal protein L30
MTDTKKIRLTLTKSMITQDQPHRRICAALGLRRMNQSVIKNDTPQIRGMVKKISYLLTVEELA